MFGPRDQDRAVKLLAQALYCSGTPHTMENEEWLDFFAFFRPTFKVSSRHGLSKKLLDNIYSEVQEEVNEKIEKTLSLSSECDSWSNIRNEGIINFIVHTPRVVFYKSIKPLQNSESAEYIAG